MNDQIPKFCPEDALQRLLSAIADENEAMLSEYLECYPADARLHFLLGSLEAARRDYGSARLAMRRAIDLNPSFHIARFQLGLLLLTSGDAYAAQETWGPLYGLPDDDALRLFARGLSHMVHDQFADAIDHIERGIERNAENEPLNRDMQRIVDELSSRTSAEKTEILSATQLLLRHATFKSTRH